MRLRVRLTRDGFAVPSPLTLDKQEKTHMNKMVSVVAILIAAGLHI